MRGHDEDIRARGAEVVAIGMGTPEMAAHFKQTQDIPFLLLVDRDRRTYQALDIARGSLLDVAGPKVWLRGFNNVLRGKRQARPQQDPLQLGGAAVIGPGGRVLYVHRGKTSADNAPPGELIAALP